MLGFKAKDRIKMLEETGRAMDRMTVIPKVDGHDLSDEERAAIDLSDEERAAIDLGARVGFTIAKMIAKGACDDMTPTEIAAGLYATAFGMYIEDVVLAEDEGREGEGEGDHAEE